MIFSIFVILFYINKTTFFIYFLAFSTVFNRHRKRGQESSGRHVAKGRRSDANLGQLLSAAWHVVACSTY